ncbi:lasso peptide biosynthesis B2 protein [Calothrix sp. 336/3]|uniref:lasso peptide biosynthesis B2 protein n=1 Tax=Calothrix sp. 336/3 TaxID=1337936 RepID=UPI0004E3AD75|nr:lasso peptide biosynthesis B2 protein [Calothrix sp. 336/3]AKG20937.1 hypothetical protein IJ00_06175 [Calothrix sp. 336/3]
MRLLHKLQRLQPGDLQFLAQTFLILAAIRIGLKLFKFRDLLKFLHRISQPSCKTAKPVSINKIVWAVNVATRYLPGVKCLARALATELIMRRNGYNPELRIGVAKDTTGKLEAHAWIEYQGLIIIGNLSDLSRFMPLPSLVGVKI